ncbi:hypothetical protein LCGC14_2070810 [marine sediment metagenome]|uniref:Glycosyl transferase family 1 domain-containing protein n=1 Tax=marine sediment metagenome TaxID=412755 RepID=A0A0F9F5V1_9ZZZZ
MRIGINFHTTDRYISGVERYSLGLIDALLSQDDENEYIVFTNQPQIVRDNVRSARNLCIESLTNIKTRAQRILWEHICLPKVAEKHRIDVLHCPHYICPYFRSNVPYVVTVHDTIALDFPQWCRKTNAIYYKMTMKSAVNNAAKIIAVSKYTAERLNCHFEDTTGKVRVIHPGIDAVFTDESDDNRQAEVRAKYNLPQKYILFVGNIEPKKNVVALLKASELLEDMGLSHKLVLAGKRSWKSKHVLEEINTQSKANKVVVTQYVLQEDLPFIYQMADVFVFPSLCEGFGFPPLEAMACGTAVIATGVGVLRELTDEYCRVIDPADHRGIARRIALLVRNEKIRRQYITAGLRIRSKFSWEQAANQTLSVYKEVAGSYVSN